MIRLARVLPVYARGWLRTEWQLGLLALGGLAPGVATVSAWLSLARALPGDNSLLNSAYWMFPRWLLALIGVRGVLVGAGVVTLLIGCLGLTNVYLASLERRTPDLLLLRRLGLPRRGLLLLLLLETIVIGALGSLAGVCLGALLVRVGRPAATQYFGLITEGGWRLSLSDGFAGFAIGMLAALLFMGLVVIRLSPHSLGNRIRPEATRRLRTSEFETTLLGALLAALLMGLVALPLLSVSATLLLMLLGAGVGLLLTGAGWALTRGYSRLPTSTRRPLWSMALHGLAQRPNYTAGMALALTAGAYAMGLAILNWLLADVQPYLFPFLVAVMVLLAAAALILTASALSMEERRTEYGLLMALGSSRRRIWRLALTQYGLLALGASLIGALLVLITAALTSHPEPWWVLGSVLLADLTGAILTAWVGVVPVLAYMTRRWPGELLRKRS